MSHVLENILDIEALASLCQKDQHQYVSLREAGAPQEWVNAHVEVMDGNSHEYDKMMGSLSLDNPDQMLRFIRAVKALGAVETLERIQEGGEFSNWVNLGLESWVNRIKAEATDD